MFEAEVTEFRSRLGDHPGIGALPGERLDRLAAFYEMVLAENEVQNLTRLLKPQDFFEGHVLDAWELEASGALAVPALDLGTGVGSPGLIHAILFDQPWILCDSERQKIGFIDRVIAQLSIKNVATTHQRAESYMDSHGVKCVVAKAVGKVEKIYGWIRECSTWNTMILLKGPAWDEEWRLFLQSKFGKQLSVTKIHPYRVGAGNFERKIVVLRRS